MVAAAVVGAAAVGAVGSGIAADKQRSAGNKAADAQTRSQQEANQLQRDMFNANAGLTEFQRGIGNQALEQLGGLYGLEGGYNPAGTVRFDDFGNIINEGPQGAPGERDTAPDFSNFFLSPEYNFALQQGQQGLDQNRAARGNLFSGGAAKEASRFNQGLATQQFGNYTNNLARLAGIGVDSTNQLGNTLQMTGNNIGNGLQNIGNARASGYINAGNAQANGINGIASSISGGLGAFAGGMG